MTRGHSESYYFHIIEQDLDIWCRLSTITVYFFSPELSRKWYDSGEYFVQYNVTSRRQREHIQFGSDQYPVSVSDT